MDRAAAINEITNIFAAYKTIQPADMQLLQALKDGKLYELYVLSHVVEDLCTRGFHLTFVGSSLRFKSSPGKLKTSDPHFEIVSQTAQPQRLWLFVDIEFQTLGSAEVGASDNSCRHEIDIVVVNVRTGYPTHAQIALGVECKAVANFSKSIVKEVLGVRRELSLLSQPQSSVLSQHGGKPSINVPANPPSEYWLAYIDSHGDAYKESPAAFGVEFKHLEP